MRRRYIAALAVFVPVAAVAIVQRYYPLSYDALSGYMLLIAVMFKGALLSFWTASKLKILAFFKGLTLLQGAILLVKRWFLDNVFARWLKRNILDPISGGLREFYSFFSALNLRTRFKNFLLPILGGSGVMVLLYLSGYLNHILLFTEIKVIVISISKTALLILGKIFGFMLDSWISPILEVFALSYFFSWLEDRFGPDNWLVRLLSSAGALMRHWLSSWSRWSHKYIDPLLNDKVRDHSNRAGEAIRTYVESKKIAYEYDQFDRLEKAILKGHIDAYHHIDDMNQITDKRKLYNLINHYTSDNLNIVGYISRDSKGRLVGTDVDDDYYNDLFILEGMASSQSHGITSTKEIDPDSSDFWVLNTSRYPLILKSHSDIFADTLINPNSLILIKTTQIPDYHDGDVYAAYGGDTESLVAVDADVESPY